MGPSLNRVIHFLHRAAAPPRDEPTDGELLRCFVAGREEAAFTALVRRHAALVLGVCRRLLSDHDADDAFQATFLVLARKAGSVRKCDSVASWLHGVALRVARQARRSAMRQQKRRAGPMILAAAVDPVDEAARRELRPLLDEELSRLPEKYRAPLVLCYLEGKTNEEAARLLGWTKGTVSGRLARARDLLRCRLVRRGLALSAGGLAALLAEAPAPVAAALVGTTVTAVLTGGSSAAATALAEGVMRAMFITRLTGFGCVGLIVLLIAGAGALGQPAPEEKALADKPGVLFGGPANIAAAAEAEDKLDGVWKAVHLEENGVKAPAKVARKFTVVINGKEMTINPDTEKRRSTFSLDSRKTPHVIVVTPQDGPGKGQPIAGIYELKKGKLTICIDRAAGKARPTDFATKPGSGLALMVLERTDEKAVEAPRNLGKLLWQHAGRGKVRLAVSPDGRFVAAGGATDVRLFDAGTGKLVRELERDGPVRAVAFSPDGRRLAVAGAAGGDVKSPGNVRVFDIDTGKRLMTLSVGTAMATAVGYTRDGRSLISGNSEGGTLVWDANTGRTVASLARHKGEITALAISPDGKLLATGSADMMVGFWDLASSKLINALKSSSEVESIAFSPDGRAIVLVRRTGPAVIWDKISKATRGNLPGHKLGTRAAAFSPGGKLIATGGLDENVTLIAMGRRALVGTFPAHSGGAVSVVFGPDGRWLVTADGRGNVRAWRVAPAPPGGQ